MTSASMRRASSRPKIFSRGCVRRARRRTRPRRDLREKEPHSCRHRSAAPGGAQRRSSSKTRPRSASTSSPCARPCVTASSAARCASIHAASAGVALRCVSGASAAFDSGKQICDLCPIRIRRCAFAPDAPNRSARRRRAAAIASAGVRKLASSGRFCRSRPISKRGARRSISARESPRRVKDGRAARRYPWPRVSPGCEERAPGEPAIGARAQRLACRIVDLDAEAASARRRRGGRDRDPASPAPLSRRRLQNLAQSDGERRALPRARPPPRSSSRPRAPSRSRLGAACSR